MNSFSWSDGIRAAFGYCLPCFTSSLQPSDDSQGSDVEVPSGSRRSHYDELEGLLADVETDADIETMSLHSNIGHSQNIVKKKKKGRKLKNIRLFGFDLFGHPPIHLSESEDENATNLNSGRRHISTTISSSSNSAFDSDASPLDATAISALTAQEAALRAQYEAEQKEQERLRQEERRSREERRKRRKKRRQLEIAAAAMGNNDEEFEGFQGSGQLRSPFSASSGIRTPSSIGGPASEEFGPYAVASALDEADGLADFGGEVYAGERRARGSNSSRSHTHSDSISRSSTSQLKTNVSRNKHSTSSRSSSTPSLGPGSPSLLTPGGNNGAAHSPLSAAQREALQSLKPGLKAVGNASTSSQSASVQSPVDFSFNEVLVASEPPIVDDRLIRPPTDLTAGQPISKFPSVGFGGVRRSTTSGLQTSGVFLARRGDDN